MRVIDTLPSMPNMWRVIRIDPFGKEMEEGLINVEVTMANWSQKVSAGNVSSFPIISRFSQNRRLNSTPGPEGFQSLTTKPGASVGPYELYQPVKMFKGNNVNSMCFLSIK